MEPDKKFNYIKDDVLIIRRLQSSDLPMMLAERNLEEQYHLQKWNLPQNKDSIHQLIHSQIALSPDTVNKPFTLAIEAISLNRMVGEITAKTDPFDPRQVELQLIIYKSHQETGYGKKALHLILHYFFHTRKKNKTLFYLPRTNHRGAYFLSESGLTLEAHFKNNACIQGVWHDELMYSMLEREFHSKNSKITIQAQAI